MLRPCEEADVTAVAWDAFAGLTEERAGRDVRIRVEPLPDCGLDSPELKEVFAGLLSIALRFTADRQPAEIFVGARGGVYFVSDNGTGLEDGHADAALGSVRRIVEAHGGRAWMDAAPGAGATSFFTVDGGTA
jgi:two-component system, chemotaxis family, sensor kinase Cph1